MNDLRVTVIQSDLYWENIGANLAMFEEKIWKIEGPTDLIVLPEMFTTGFTMEAAKLAEPMNSTTTRWMKQMAAQTGAMVVGSFIVNDGGKYYNRLLAVKPDGSYHTYDKKHLFVLAGEGKAYTPGTSKTVFNWNGWNICPLICYDLRFPVFARSVRTAQQEYEYDLLLYVANWPVPRIHAWDTLLQARAIENISYCAGVNRTGRDGIGMDYCGHTAVYNYKGEALIAPTMQDSISTTTLYWQELSAFRERFPFQRDSDGFSLGLI